METLGAYLLDRGLKYEVVAIGGGALLLLGCIVRPTKDLDLVALIEEDRLISADPLPAPLVAAIREVGSALRFTEDWINPGPASLWEIGLPEGFQSRLGPLYFGGLTVYYASRFDQICFKLYASVDYGPGSKHFEDLKLLKPTQQELEKAGAWCKTHDVSENFAKALSEALLHIKG